MLINEKLSNWDALHTCFCGRWQWQPSPARSPDGICYERNDASDTQLSTKVRTWRAIDEEGNPRTWEHIGPKACEVCGYDLTRTPRQNIKAITPEEWAAGVVVNTCLAHEGAAVDILPEGVAVQFDGCNLTNVALRAEHAMLPVGRALDGKAVSLRAVACSHNRVAVQNDGRDWVCRWKASEGKAEGSPVQPIDYKASLLEGRNVDPAALPDKPLTSEELKAEQQAHERWQARVTMAREYVAKDGWVPCECIATRKADVEAKLRAVVSASAVMPDKTCAICAGAGAIGPETVAAREKAAEAESKLAAEQATTADREE